jgi:hypothetical protein
MLSRPDSGILYRATIIFIFCIHQEGRKKRFSTCIVGQTLSWGGQVAKKVKKGKEFLTTDARG